jgi:hypothetical protein
MDERESPSPIRLLAELWRPVIPGLVIVVIFAATKGGATMTDLVNSFLFGVAALSPFVAAYFVWSVVCYVNRHDDPRYGKRPADPP